MTVLGGHKVNVKGRSVGALRTNRRTKIQGQFAARTIDMLESPAFRVLSLSARRVLDRLRSSSRIMAGRTTVACQ
jgi:hypothetical protein